MNRDFMGIVLEVGQSSKDEKIRKLYEDVRDGSFTSLKDYEVGESVLNESESEPLNCQGLKVVKEKYGQGVSVTSNGKEYRFTSSELTAEELEKKLPSLFESKSDLIESGVFCYFTQSLNEEVKEKTETLDENTVYDGYKIKWVKGDGSREKHVEVYDGRKLVATYDTEDEAKSAIDKGELNEATQSADAATKVDQGPSKYPVEGKAYEFADGMFVVEAIIKDVVYLIGPDDEYYSMSVEDFQNEVISPMNEAGSESELTTQVRETMIRKWLSGKGGLSDSAWQKIADRLADKFGWDYDEMLDEFERQVHVLDGIYQRDKARYNQLRMAANNKKPLKFE